jgi:hypothetical protein
MPLLTYADLLAPSKSDPTKSVAVVSLARMRSASMPMPPGAALPTAEIAVLANWVANGTLTGSCSTQPLPDAAAGGAGGQSASAGAGGQSPSAGAGGSAGAATATGLPCDVSQLLAAQCQGCHGSTPTPGTPMPLVTYADLLAPSKSDPSKSVAAVSLARMQSTSIPMPPGAPPTAAQVAVIANWITAGTPKGSCGGQVGPSADAATDAPANPFATPVVCTSKVTWPPGGNTSSLMAPGQGCITCHKTNPDAPQFTLAGTVYATAHEPNNCNGSSQTGSAPISVVVTDSQGTTITMPVNAAGNFSRTGALSLPYRAKVVAGASARVMASAQTNGDCNSCHTQDGLNGAPGRIVAP